MRHGRDASTRRAGNPVTASPRLRRPIHRGSVLASGLVLDTQLIGEDEARVRLLTLGERAPDVFRTGGLLVATFRQPVRMQTDRAPGAPLVRYGRLLSMAPLEDDEQRTLEVSVESALLTSRGEATVAPLERAALEDLSSWLDVSSFSVEHNLVPLGGVASEPDCRWQAVPEDVRKPLGVTALAPEGAAVAASLAELATAPSDRARGATRTSVVRGFLDALRGLASAVFTRATKPNTDSTSQGRELAPYDASPGTPSWFSKVRALLHRAAVRLLVWSRFASLIGRRQREYFARMLEMFDARDLDEALRHAIPLTDDVAKALAPPPLRTPSPRADLAIVPARGASATSFGLEQDLFALLKHKYRQAFDRLVALGELEKAAFVLAELLNASEEAVSFLERHGRRRLAPEIAEARNLQPGLVVRQWFVAGEIDRAVRFARKTGAFGPASRDPAAGALRALWADSLASAGSFVAAVDAAWSAPELRSLAAMWLERAIAVGGPTGARMLVKMARLKPESFTEVRDRIVALLDEERPEEERDHLIRAIGRELVADGATDGTRILAKIVARELVAGTGETRDDDGARLLERLLSASGDATFRADVTACAVKPTPKAPPVVQLQAYSRIGNVGTSNEDACIATFLDERANDREGVVLDGDASRHGVLLGAIDGSAGGLLADLAKRATLAFLQKRFSVHGNSVDTWARHLASAVEHAGREIHREATTTAARRGAGCTATFATVSGRTLLFAQVGDTRGYVLRAGQLVQVTKVHTLLEEQLANGLVPAKEIESFPHVITRALGTKEDVRPDLVRVDLHRDDVVLLCSDGLSSVLSETEIRDALVGKAPEAACDALISRVLDETEARDNIAVVVARVFGDALPPADGAPVQYETMDPRWLDGRQATAGQALRTRAEPLVVHRTEADAGALDVHDVAELPDGRLLVALGEIGVWLVSRDGKVLVRFAEPTHHIVISGHGDRAILVAPRGDVHRVARLDLLTRRVRSWCDARFDVFAPDFDGATWYVGRGGAVFAIDALSERWERAWALETLDGQSHAQVRSIQRSALSVHALHVHEGEQGGASEIWSLELPGHTLRRREAFDGRAGTVAARSANIHLPQISATGRLAAWLTQLDGPAFVGCTYDRVAWNELSRKFEGTPHTPSLSDEWIAFSTTSPDGLTVHLCEATPLRECATVRLDAPSPAQEGPRGRDEERFVRFQGDRALIFDRHGRVLVFSLKSGRVLREHRIS